MPLPFIDTGDPNMDPNNWYSEQVPMTSVPIGEFQSPNLGLEVMEAPASECCAYEGGFHGGCAYGGSYYGEGCHGGVHGGAPTYLENHTHPSPSFSPPDSSYFPQSYPELQNPLPPLSFEQRISSQFKKITEALHHIYSATPNPPIPSFAPTNCSYLPPSYPSDYVCTHVSPLSSSTTSLILPIAYTPTHPYSASVTLSHSEIPNFTPPPPLSELPMPYQPPSLILESHSNSWSILPHPSSMPMANDVHAITVQSLPSSHLYQQSTVDSSVSQFESLGLELHMGTLLATQSSSPKLVLHTNLDIDDKLQLVNLEATSLTPAIGNDSSPFSIQSPIEEDIKCWSFRELEKTSIELFQSGDTIPGSKFSICCNDVGHFNFNCTNGCSASGFTSHEDYENSDAFGECKSIPPSDTHCPNMGQFHPAPESPPNTGHTHVQFGDFEGNPSYPKKLTLILKKKKQWSMRMKRKLQVLRKGKNLANGNSKTAMSSPQVMGQLCKVPWPLPKFHKLIHMFRHPRYYHPECGFAEFAIVLLNENKYGYVSSLVNDHFGRLNMVETSQCAAFNLDFHQSAINMAFLTNHMGDKVYESHILQKFLHDIIKLGCEYNFIIGIATVNGGMGQGSLFGGNMFDKLTLSSEVVLKRKWERWKSHVSFRSSVYEFCGNKLHMTFFFKCKAPEHKCVRDTLSHLGSCVSLVDMTCVRDILPAHFGSSTTEAFDYMLHLKGLRECIIIISQNLFVFIQNMGINEALVPTLHYQLSSLTVELCNESIQANAYESGTANCKGLLNMGSSGVIALFITASQRFRSSEHKCLQALAIVVHSSNESSSSSCLIPGILLLESYFHSANKYNCNGSTGVQMHTDIIPEAAKDEEEASVIEAFLYSDSSTKLKRRWVVRFGRHVGEPSLHSSGTIIVGKCFTTSNISHMVFILSELLAGRSEFCNTIQGPRLMRRKLAIVGFFTRLDLLYSSLRNFSTMHTYFPWQPNNILLMGVHIWALVLHGFVNKKILSLKNIMDFLHDCRPHDEMRTCFLWTIQAFSTYKDYERLHCAALSTTSSASKFYSNLDQFSDMNFMMGECNGSACLELINGFSSLIATIWCHYNLGICAMLALLQNFVSLFLKVSVCLSIQGYYEYGTHLIAGPNSNFWTNSSRAHHSGYHYNNAWGNLRGATASTKLSSHVDVQDNAVHGHFSLPIKA